MGLTNGAANVISIIAPLIVGVIVTDEVKSLTIIMSVAWNYFTFSN